MYALASDHFAMTETAIFGGHEAGFLINEQCQYIFADTLVVSMSCEVIDGTTDGTFVNTVPVRTLVLNEQSISPFP
jgi:hypothetical protein